MPEHQRYLMTVPHPHHPESIEPFTGELVATSQVDASEKADELVDGIAENWAVGRFSLHPEVHPLQVLGLDWELVDAFYQALPDRLRQVAYLPFQDLLVRVVKTDWSAYELEVVKAGPDPVRYLVGARSSGTSGPFVRQLAGGDRHQGGMTFREALVWALIGEES